MHHVQGSQLVIPLTIFLQVQPLKWLLPLKWRRGKDAPFGICDWHAVILNGIMYVGSEDRCSVLQYNLRSGEWSVIPGFLSGCTMTSLNGQLVAVGHSADHYSDQIRVWDSASGEWGYPYPHMPNGRAHSAAVVYQNYLIAACGDWEVDQIEDCGCTDTVEVLDSSSGRWYSAQPVPLEGPVMSSAVVGDHWYLLFDLDFEPDSVIFSAHLPTLISSATSAAQTNTTSIWHELPTPPVDLPTLLALQSHLLLVGGQGLLQKLHRYDPQAKEWRECGQLPVGMGGLSCAVLPSGELMVVGGFVKGVRGRSKQTWIGKFDA